LRSSDEETIYTTVGSPSAMNSDNTARFTSYFEYIVKFN
jgi:hypothetical protein